MSPIQQWNEPPQRVDGISLIRYSKTRVRWPYVADAVAVDCLLWQGELDCMTTEVFYSPVILRERPEQCNQNGAQPVESAHL